MVFKFFKACFYHVINFWSPKICKYGHYLYSFLVKTLKKTPLSTSKKNQRNMITLTSSGLKEGVFLYLHISLNQSVVLIAPLLTDVDFGIIVAAPVKTKIKEILWILEIWSFKIEMKSSKTFVLCILIFQ